MIPAIDVDELLTEEDELLTEEDGGADEMELDGAGAQDHQNCG